MVGPSSGVGLGGGATVCVGIGVGVVVGVGVGVAVGIGVEVGSGVGVADAVGARVLVGIAAGVRVGVADAIAVGVVVGDMAIGVSVGAGAHAANSKRLKHTTLALHESRASIFPDPFGHESTNLRAYESTIVHLCHAENAPGDQRSVPHRPAFVGPSLRQLARRHNPLLLAGGGPSGRYD